VTIDLEPSRRSTLLDAFARRLGPLRSWLPPISRREFWAVQGLVVLIAAGHTVLDASRPTIEPRDLYLVPTSLYFVPVVYAALNFGLRGSVATALWSVVLTLPDMVVWDAGLERIAEGWQMAIVLAVAAFVGQRVDREARARRQAEEREDERRRSEARYRGLFDNAAEAVLVLGQGSAITEANEAAARLLGRSLEALRGVELSAVLGPELAAQLLGGNEGRVVALPGQQGTRPTWVQPVVCLTGSALEGAAEIELMLPDVTLQHERQRDLEAYARGVLAAREEEQRRIGRELHDGPLQSLVLVCRKLDTIDDAEGSGPAAEARSLAEATADELRRISRALRPSVLEDLGLPAALKSEATALARRTGINVRFVHQGSETRLPAAVELALLRVAQEALHNVERHAAATTVLVRLTHGPGRARLQVRDDGCGYAPQSVSELLGAGKLGLVGMGERARLVGGQMTTRTCEGVGTTVEISVPLALAANEESMTSTEVTASG
jgi:signal transduction histidine kinase